MGAEKLRLDEKKTPWSGGLLAEGARLLAPASTIALKNEKKKETGNFFHSMSRML
jgi:hypothetical protein